VEPTAQDLVSIHCSTCDTKIRIGDERCTSCKRKVTSDEIEALRRRWEASDPEARRRGDAVAYGRGALLVVAGLAFIEAMIYGLGLESMPTLAFDLVIGASMVGLFFGGRRRPFDAMVAGATLYLVVQGLAAIVSLETLFQGILTKILIVMTLTGGIGAELRRRKLERAVAGRRAG
jgi:hypothetical protein